MTHPFDLAPTAPLRGPHLKGVVRRRFLVSYPVPPPALEPFLPPGAEPVVRDGSAWVSACFVRMAHMRPAGLPPGLGLSFHYLVHRTMAMLPFPDGVHRKSVLILEANVDHPLATAGGRAAGVRFRRRHLAVAPTPEGERITMHADGLVLFDAIMQPDAGLPAASRFTDADDADRFVAGMSYGAQWQPPRLRLFAETHDPWTIQVGSCRTLRNDFLERLGLTVAADHAIAMDDVPHAFAMRPVTVRVPG